MTLLFEPQVAVVDFHHARGPEVEFWITTSGKDLYGDNEWTLLPFLALSDGAHASIEDFAYFTLLCKTSSPTNTDALINDPASPASGWRKSPASAPMSEHAHENLPGVSAVPPTNSGGERTSEARPKIQEGRSLFGIACTRQIRANRLKTKSKDVTRSTVQKAVVVLLETPGMLGAVRERLGAVTGAWFGQEDFTNIDILKEFQESLKRDGYSYTSKQEVPIGLSIREIVHEFRWQTLVLVKALLLQKKLLFFGTRCERLCLLQFALISLIPNLVQHLGDCADPALDSYARSITRATSLRTSERSSLLAYMGLPLQVFGEGSFFSPYTPLQQIDLLMDASTHSFMVGSTNALLLAQNDRYCDVLVNLDEETNRISIVNPALRGALALSAADRRWVDNITQGVSDTWDPENPSRPNTHGYPNSEDAIRLQFEEYILSLLSSVAYKSHHDTQPPGPSSSNAELPKTEPMETTDDFNNDFVSLWKQTPNYALFHRLTKDAGIFDIIEPRHPTAGGLNIEDVQRRLAQGVAELHLDERVKEGRETMGRVIGEGRERVGAGVARFWKEMEDYRQKRESTRSRDESQGDKVDVTAIRDNITGSKESDTGVGSNSTSSSAVANSWTTTLRERASKVQLQRPEINTTQISTVARDNAAKAGQYLSSWGSWARDRGKEWNESRR